MPFSLKIRFPFSLQSQEHKGREKPVSPELFHQKAARSLLCFTSHDLMLFGSLSFSGILY